MKRPKKGRVSARKAAFRAPAKERGRAHESPSRAWMLWLLVSLTVFAALPKMTSGNYLPKTFWASWTVGVGLLALFPRRPDRLEITWLGGVWIAYLAWALVSLTWAPQPRVGFERWLALLLPTLAYLLAKRTRFWESDAFWVSFSVLAGTVAFIGFLQYDPKGIVPSFIKTFVDWFPGTAIPRTTMGQRNYASLYFILTVPFLAWTYFHARGRQWILPFVSLALSVLFLLLARTRSAWLGSAAGLAFLFLAGLSRLLRARMARVKILAACGLALVLVAAFLPPGKEAGKSLGGVKANLFLTLKDFLNSAHRTEMWRDTLSVPLNRLTGAGFGNFPILATPHSVEQKVKTLNYEVHNDYLQAFVDLGVPGFLLFSLTCLLLIRLAWRRRREGGLVLAAGAAIAGLTVMQGFNFTSELVCSLVMAAGIIAILNSQPSERPLISWRVFPGLPIALNLLAAVWLLVFAVVVGFAIRGDKEFCRVQTLIAAIPKADTSQRAARIKIAAAEVERLAQQTLPWTQFDANMRHVNCHILTGIALSMKDYKSADIFARKALELHPYDWSCLFSLAEIALAKNEAADTEKILREGIEKFGCNPYAVFAPNLLKVLLHRGAQKEAEALRIEMEQYRVGAPAAPAPANRAAKVPLLTAFDWSDCSAALSYDLYLWKVGEEKPEKPLLRGLRQSATPRPLQLKPNTVYLWQVRAVGRYKREDGEIWVFRTQ